MKKRKLAKGLLFIANYVDVCRESFRREIPPGQIYSRAHLKVSNDL